MKTLHKGKLAIKWDALRALAQPISIDCTKAIGEYQLFAKHLIDNYGFKTSLKVLKDLHSRSKLVSLLGKVPREPFGGVWLSVRRTGLPKKLPLLSQLLRDGSVMEKRFATTLTSSVEALRSEPDYDINTIIEPFSGESRAIEEYSNLIAGEASYVKVSPISRTEDTKYHLSFKGGPTGSPNVINASRETHAILYGKYSSEIRWAAGVFGRMDVISMAEKCHSDTDPALRSTNDILAKLVFLADKAGKTRVVYAPSWWIQEILYEFHKELYRILEQFETDGTSSHDRAASLIKDWTSQKRELWSYDLKAATDRFPKALQTVAISELFTNSIAEAWSELMAIPAFSPYHKKMIHYSVGQPMGMFSSWAAFAVTHHLLLRGICRNNKVKDLYAIIGDDIVIAHKKVAEDYERALNRLGLTISESKTIRPKPNSPSVAEFAKRLFRNGVELTPLSVNLLNKVFLDRQWSVFEQIVSEIQRKWGVIQEYNQPDLMLHSPASNLLSLVPPKEREKLATFFTFPLRGLAKAPKGQCLCPKNDPVKLENPWKGKFELTVQGYDFRIVGEELALQVQKLFKLWELVDKGTPVKASELEAMLMYKTHPLWPVIERVARVAVNAGRSLQNGELSRKEVSDLGMDLDYIINLFERGLSYKDHRSQKDRRSKGMVLHTCKVLEAYDSFSKRKAAYKPEDDDLSGF